MLSLQECFPEYKALEIIHQLENLIQVLVVRGDIGVRERESRNEWGGGVLGRERSGF